MSLLGVQLSFYNKRNSDGSYYYKLPAFSGYFFYKILGDINLLLPFMICLLKTRLQVTDTPGLLKRCDGKEFLKSVW